MGKGYLFGDYLNVDESSINLDENSIKLIDKAATIDTGYFATIDEIQSGIKISDYHNKMFIDGVSSDLDEMKDKLSYLSNEIKCTTTKKKRKITVKVRL